MSAEDRHAKKKLFIWKRNKRDLLILRQRMAREKEQKRIEGLKKQQSARPADTVKDAEIWSAKTQDIRNKLTGKKRQAAERWNRFAGTEGGGGKGL